MSCLQKRNISLSRYYGGNDIRGNNIMRGRIVIRVRGISRCIYNVLSLSLYLLSYFPNVFHRYAIFCPASCIGSDIVAGQSICPSSLPLLTFRNIQRK